MKTRSMSLALAAGVALAVSVGSAARADDASPEGAGAGQARIAATTLELERAFSSQFIAGHVDRAALEPLVQDVLQATPADARPRVEARVEQVVADGQSLAAQLTPEQRTALATRPARGALGERQIALVNAWGWPGFTGSGNAGWGGLGAFGFPGMFGGGAFCGFGSAWGCPGLGLGSAPWYWW